MKNELIPKLVYSHWKYPISIEKSRFENNIVFRQKNKENDSEPIAKVAEIGQIVMVTPSFIINTFLNDHKGS